MNNAASPPQRSIAHCISFTYTAIVRDAVNQTNVCTIRRLDSFCSAGDGSILKANRYNPSKQLL